MSGITLLSALERLLSETYAETKDSISFRSSEVFFKSLSTLLLFDVFVMAELCEVLLGIVLFVSLGFVLAALIGCSSVVAASELSSFPSSEDVFEDSDSSVEFPSELSFESVLFSSAANVSDKGTSLGVEANALTSNSCLAVPVSSTEFSEQGPRASAAQASENGATTIAPSFTTA